MTAAICKSAAIRSETAHSRLGAQTETHTLENWTERAKRGKAKGVIVEEATVILNKTKAAAEHQGALGRGKKLRTASEEKPTTCKRLTVLTSKVQTHKCEKGTYCEATRASKRKRPAHLCAPKPGCNTYVGDGTPKNLAARKRLPSSILVARDLGPTRRHQRIRCTVSSLDWLMMTRLSGNLRPWRIRCRRRARAPKTWVHRGPGCAPKQ